MWRKISPYIPAFAFFIIGGGLQVSGIKIPWLGYFLMGFGVLLLFIPVWLYIRRKMHNRGVKKVDDWYKSASVDNPKDKSWSTATLDQYPIAPEVLPIVLKVWKYRTEKGSDFTIREAKWISHLSVLLTDIDKLSYKGWQYARTELMFELIGRPFDSTVLDKLLMGLPAGIGNFMDFLSILSEQREDQEKGIKDGVEQIRELVKDKSKKLHIHRTGTAGTVEVLAKKKKGG
jgi:hypothetical protein